MVTRASLLAVLLAAAAGVRADEASAVVVLRWQAVAGAAAYEVQVALDPHFAEPAVATRVEAPSYRWRAIPDARHHWRVRALDARGRAGPWSEIKVIEAALRAPQPLLPPEGERLAWDRDGATVVLAGEPLAVLREYRLEVDADPGFRSPVVSRRGPAPVFQVELPGAGTFHWRLGGVALDGRETSWSPSRSFSVALVPPRPLAPSPGEALPFGPAALAWTTVRPAARWRLWLEREGEPSRQVEVAAPPWTFTPDRPGRHRFRVAAVLPDGSVGPASEAREFLVEPPLPVPAPRPLALEPAAPAGDGRLDPVAFAPGASLPGPGPPSAGSNSGRWCAGALAGWRSNLLGVSAAAVGLEASWRAPVLGSRLLVSARGSWYSTSTSVAGGGLPAPVQASAHVFPLALLALYEWPTTWARLYGGMGAGGHVALVAVGEAREIQAGLGLEAAAGAGRRVGPGEAFLEVGASLGAVGGRLATLRTGGLTLAGGYRLWP